MARKAAVIELSQEERRQLQSWVRSGTTEQRLVFRARIVLMADDGRATAQMARRLVCNPSTVSKWRRRFVRQRLARWQDAPRSGKPRRYTEEHRRQILAKLDEPPPEGYATWNGRLSADFVWAVLREYGISLQRRRSWCISTDPEFAAKAVDIVGLYLDSAENAVELCVDEKPSIRALERAQGWLKLPNGKALTGYSHEYERHGTTTLFAALEVAMGLV